MAAFTNASELMFVRKLINELQPNDLKAVLHIDNQPTLDILRNGKSKIKHIDIKLKKMSEWVTEDLYNFKKISTKANYADIFTKPLRIQVFKEFRDKFMMETFKPPKPEEDSDWQGSTGQATAQDKISRYVQI